MNYLEESTQFHRYEILLQSENPTIYALNPLLPFNWVNICRM